MYIYVAGKMKGTWRNDIIKIIENNGHTALVPRDGHKNDFDIVQEDLRKVKNSDMIIACVFETAPNIGTSMEIKHAWDNGIPIVTMKKKNHPWINVMSTRKFRKMKTLKNSLPKILKEVS